MADAAAAAAGEALLANRAQWGVIEAEHGREVKIDADKHAEAHRARRARSARATIRSSPKKPAGRARCSAAIASSGRSIRSTAASIICAAIRIAPFRSRCWIRAQPVLGVVDCFVTRERFTGVVGEGAWLNGAPMRVSDIANPAKGILQTGVPSRASDDSMKAFEQRLRTWQKVRMIGSAATALAYVAAGRAEAYRESGSMIWDVAAAARW